MTNEHDTYSDATSGAEALDFRHKEGSARCWYEATAPANAPSSGALAGGHLWVDSDDKVIRVYDGSTWQPVVPLASSATVDYHTDQSGGDALKAKVLTLTYNSGYIYDAAHGLDQTKIMGIAGMGIYPGGGGTEGLIQAGPYVTATDVAVYSLTSGSGQTFRVVVFYTD